ncbi:MAG: hypothetical protein LLG00_09755 [Planctomycetaceae bacterium]|nr:hypothetical protein [Planctomycetaceae bacterium]
MDDRSPEHPGVHFERKDVRFGCLLAALLAAGCVLVGLSYTIWQFYWWQAGVHEREGRSPYPMAPAPSTRLPREPRLEQLERMARVESDTLSSRLAAQQRVLDSYGPSGEKGFVHIPIEQAIKAVAGRLPVRHKPPEAPVKSRGLVNSGDSNSGRMFRGDSP